MVFFFFRVFVICFCRCGGLVDEDVLLYIMFCGDINDYFWLGVIMKLSCEFDSEYNEYINDCKSIE